MKLFLGVDGGQSSTKAIIGDEAGRILGEGAGGPFNHARAGEGRARFERGMRESLRAACESAGLDAASARFEAACFGMSGGPDDKEAILREILPARRVIVTTDAAIALAGAVEGGNGVIVIAGTGSIAYGKNAAGKTARAGGWGYIFGDEGSGFDVVRQALRAVLRAEEGWGPEAPRLRRELLAATGAANANDALHRLYGDEWPRSRTAALAAAVDAAARDGDRMAADVLNRTAHELAMLAASVRGQLWPAGEQVQVAYIGGVFKSATVLERFTALVDLSGDRCVEPRYGPAEGALLEAYRCAGLSPALTR
jgi:N-acetylglucosamine kinase